MAEEHQNREFMTTTEAAKILGVSPDTVLKWVKAGKIKSRRTLGGHFRIPAAALNLAGSASSSGAAEPIPQPVDHQYCWEFLAGGGPVRDECRDCITFRSRARRCYELKDLPGEFGCLNLMCDTDCNECDYFRVVNGQGVNVIAVAASGKLIADVQGSGKHYDLDIKFAASEYEVATLIQTFRPDYIVVDCSFGKRRTADICSNLFGDIRIPVPRIILASKTRRIRDYCDREVFGWIRKPFSLQQLQECIRGVPAMTKENSI